MYICVCVHSLFIFHLSNDCKILYNLDGMSTPIITIITIDYKKMIFFYFYYESIKLILLPLPPGKKEMCLCHIKSNNFSTLL